MKHLYACALAKRLRKRAGLQKNERFTARMYLDYVLSKKGITLKALEVAPVVILSWSRNWVESMAKSINAELSKHWVEIELYTKDIYC